MLAKIIAFVKTMWPAFYRALRVLLGQAIGMALVQWGGIEIPYVGITIGAAVSALFKFLRDKFPGKFEWLPL